MITGFNNRVFFFHTAVLVLLLFSLNSCTTKKVSVDTKDLSYLYNPTRSSFNPGVNINVQSDESATLSVRFLSNELFFSEANRKEFQLPE